MPFIQDACFQIIFFLGKNKKKCNGQSFCKPFAGAIELLRVELLAVSTSATALASDLLC